jgi:membrane protease YdiL (CAAX protease family)
MFSTIAKPNENLETPLPSRPTNLLARYPLISFFILAFAGPWLCLTPLVLGTNGLGLLPITLPDVPFFLLGGILGPTLAAFVMTYLTGGRKAVKELLARCKPGRVSFKWYLAVLFGPPLVLLVGECLLLGSNQLDVVVREWPKFFISYLPMVGIIVVFAQLWEEPGWSGFALPRLQEKFGPLLGLIILTLLWTLWHLPTLMIDSDIGSGKVASSDILPALVRLLLLGISIRIVMTWLFNSTRGSLLIALLIHSTIDATTNLIFTDWMVPDNTLSDWQKSLYGGWDLRITLAVVAIGLIIATRGRLSYTIKSSKN